MNILDYVFNFVFPLKLKPVLYTNSKLCSNALACQFSNTYIYLFFVYSCIITEYLFFSLYISTIGLCFCQSSFVLFINCSIQTISVSSEFKILNADDGYIVAVVNIFIDCLKI